MKEKKAHMRKFLTIWSCGTHDRKGMGNGYFVPVTIRSEMSKGECQEYLLLHFEKDCREQLGLDIASWFVTPGERSMPDKDFQTLKSFGVLPAQAVNNFNPDMFFTVWAGLFQILHPGSVVKRYYIPFTVPTGGMSLL